MERILVITNSLTGGGAERSMNLLVNELNERGEIIALMPINASVEDLIKPTCQVFPIYRSWRSGAISFVKSYLKFIKIIKMWKPTVIILNCDLPELFGAINYKSIPRIIVVEHTNRPFAARVLLGKIIRYILLKKGAEFVAVSSHLNIWQVQSKPKEILLNAIKIEPKSLIQVDSTEPAKLENIFFIGRLATIQKRPQIMLDIASHIGNKVIIIGDGEAKVEMRERILRESLSAELLGYQEDPWECLGENDVLVVPSLFEGDGMVVVEAISRDVPILLSDIPDFRRFGFPDSNYCAEPQDFIQRISEYKSDLNRLRVPIQTRREILKSRTPKAVGDSWTTYLGITHK